MLAMPFHSFTGGFMKIGATLLVKDEMDIIERCLEFYLPQLDKIIVLDNLSTDGTYEYLLKNKDPKLIVLSIPSASYYQKDWVGRACRHLINLGMDWILNLDADEFITGKIRTAIASAQGFGYNQIYPLGTFYYPTVHDQPYSSLFERMLYHDPWTKKYNNDKVIFRTIGFTGVSQGNHWVHLQEGIKQVVLRTDSLRLHHYPDRSTEQFIKKYSGKFSQIKLDNMGAGWRYRNQLWVEHGDQGLIDHFNKIVTLSAEQVKEQGLQKEENFNNF